MSTPRRIGIVSSMTVAVILALVAVLYAIPDAAAQQKTQGTTQASSLQTKSLGTNGAQAPKIDWKACQRSEGPKNYECATVKVPQSYRKPGGRKIELALGRLPAEDPGRKIGTLFWNPGGPGGPGRIPPPFSPKLRERFDIVGFDPRGVGESTPIKCFNSTRQALDTFGLPFPITLQQENKFYDANERGTRLCDSNAGPLLSHVSTANVARDMDLLRRSVDDKKLTYIGFSYGTHLGEVYANLFPKKVRALTLDAVLDPVEWTTGEKPGDALVKPFTYRLGSFEGSQDALRTFLKACANNTNNNRCAFGEKGASAKELEAKYERLLDRLRQEPVKVKTPQGTQKITYQDTVGFTLSLLYQAEASPFLANFLEDIYNATETRKERTTQEKDQESLPEVDVPEVPTRPTFERPQSRQVRQEPYAGVEWFNAVSCADTENPSNKMSWSTFAREADSEAPGFGPLWTYASTPCATWPVTDPDRYAGPWDKETANPILLIGNRQGDPATPYDDARTTTNRLADSRLLTLNSFGHTAAYGGQSRCIDEAVDRYLIEGKLPSSGKVCQPNRGPFDGVQSRSAKGGTPEGVPAEPPLPRF